MEDYQNITDKIKLNKMFIDDKHEISFDYIYKNIIPMIKNPDSNKQEILEKKYNNYIIRLIKLNSLFGEINLLKDNKIIKILQMLFIKPINFYYKKEKIELAYPNHFDDILEILKIKKPFLFCPNHNIVIKYHIQNVMQHLQSSKFGFSQCKIELSEKSSNNGNYNILFYTTFNKIKNKDEFESPTDFDINYEHYFDFYKYQKNDKKFEFFDDKYLSRNMLISDLCRSKNLLGYFRIYYGQPGMGKSATLIKTFKYIYNHDDFGTLYIHCKCLYNYYNFNFIKLKKIIKDEIIYLFKNEINNYLNCIKFIDDSKNNSNFFDLIINIITKFCNNPSKKYLFIFDQYKPEFDPNNKLYKLNKTLIRKNKNYGIIACCSMDNNSVRELKIKNLSKTLLNDEDFKQETDNIAMEEINLILDMSNIKIDNGGYFDNTLDKIGKNLKNYIALKEFHRTKDLIQLENYVNQLKKNISDNLKNFFHLNEKIKEENSDSNLINLNKILSFTVDTDYEINYIKKIKNFIPFEYFDIELKKESKGNEKIAQIIFNFELVGEVINELYDFIIQENIHIFQIFDNIKLDQGALEVLYKKYAIYFMEPDKYFHEKNVFNLFNIIDIVTVDKFVSEANEKYFKKNFTKKSLTEGDYLFKQEQFGEKPSDCAIIRNKKNGDIQVFLFQISMDKNTLYSINQLKKYIESFRKYFSYQFTLSIKLEEIYFTYIFHTKNKDKLFNDCKIKKLKCIFFNPYYQCFTNYNNNALDDINYRGSINKIFVNPFKLNNENSDINMEEHTNTGLLVDITKQNFILNDKQKYRIKELWKNLYPYLQKENIEIFFSHNTQFFRENYLSNKIMYLRQLNKNEIGDWNKALIKEERKSEIKGKNNLLLIYKAINLSFRIISEDGNIFEIKYIPIRENEGIIKRYDIYIVKNIE